MTPADIDHLRIAVAWGASDADIGATFGLAASTIRTHRLRHRVTRPRMYPCCPPRPVSPGIWSIIVRLHNAGWPVCRIAKRLRMGPPRVRRVLEGV